MHMELARIGNNPAICFAFSELTRYLRLIEPACMIKECAIQLYDPSVHKIWVGISPSFASYLPQVSDAARDDGIYIHVQNGKGIITGTNPRSVLIAVYRFLKELGVSWIRPGADGEILPPMIPKTYKVDVCEAASYRHRAICIEGAVSFEHVKNMIDWIPKASMNGYFIQFRAPYTFFDRWYSHRLNPKLCPQPLSYDDVAGMQTLLEEEIARRGLMYHTVGHGWTCEPFGIRGLGWDPVKDDFPAEIRQKFALVNGKRELWGGVPLDTNLCYSNPDVREQMANAVADYCKNHPTVNYVHVWLADGTNNNCECEECQKKRPSDFYIMILNEIDRKLTEAGIDTKIVFLMYVDLLWVNQEGTLHNPDRFLMMFAPITRSYTKKYTDFDADEQIELPPYVRNRLVFPSRVEENMAFLRSWQEKYDCDSVDFDYHLMWDHHKDPGYYRCAEILFADAQGLDKIGLNGYISCQLQRAAFPTGLPLEMMAAGLWNKDADFEAESSRYFKEAFGCGWEKARDYLKTVSEKFIPSYARGEMDLINPTVAESVKQAKETIEQFTSTIEAQIICESGNIEQSWRYLKLHASLNLLYADCIIAAAEGKTEACRANAEILFEYARSIEAEVHNVFDVFEYISTVNKVLATVLA